MSKENKVFYSTVHEEKHNAKPTGKTREISDKEWEEEYYCSECQIYYWLRKEISTLLW